MRVAFFKSKNGMWDDKLIDLLTGRKGYSHCEILLDNHTTVRSHQRDKEGTKVIHYNKNLFLNNDWTIVEIPYELKQYRLKVKYDYLGMSTFKLFGDMLVDEEKTWCSKFVLQNIQLDCNDTNISPNGLFDFLLGKLNGRIIS